MKHSRGCGQMEGREGELGREERERERRGEGGKGRRMVKGKSKG